MNSLPGSLVGAVSDGFFLDDFELLIRHGGKFFVAVVVLSWGGRVLSQVARRLKTRASGDGNMTK